MKQIPPIANYKYTNQIGILTKNNNAFEIIYLFGVSMLTLWKSKSLENQSINKGNSSMVFILCTDFHTTRFWTKIFKFQLRQLQILTNSSAPVWLTQNEDFSISKTEKSSFRKKNPGSIERKQQNSMSVS